MRSLKVDPFIAAVILLALSTGMPPAIAAITVDGATTVRDLPPGIGGTCIYGHADRFASDADGIPYRADMAAARVKVVRTITFPDYRALAHPLAYFDANIAAILKSGGQPMITQYINPPTPTIQYYSADGKLDGTGTVASNAVFLVKHYTDPAGPYRLGKFVFEVGNEPDIKVDYQTSKEDYTRTFNSVNDALVSAGVRDRVLLAGPILSGGYHLPFFDNTLNNANSQFFDYFLEHARDTVDVVVFHAYAGGADTPEHVLNLPRHLETLYDANRTVTPGKVDPNAKDTDRGMAALLGKMATIHFGRPNVGVAVTEHNVTDGKGNTSGQPMAHSLPAAIWNLAVQHFMIANPRGVGDNHFLFDAYGSQNGFGAYDRAKTPDPTYWALWIGGNLRGSRVLAATATGNPNAYGNPNLLVTATADAKYCYVEVLNRSASPVKDTVALTGVKVAGAPDIHVLSAGTRPDASRVDRTLTGTFSFDFEPRSDTIFRYTLSP